METNIDRNVQRTSAGRIISFQYKQPEGLHNIQPEIKQPTQNILRTNTANLNLRSVYLNEFSQQMNVDTNSW